MLITKRYKLIAQATFVCAIIFASCGIRQSADSTVRGVKVHYKTDFVDSAYKIITIADSLSIYYYEDYVIYIKLIGHDYLNPTHLENGETVFKDVYETKLDTQYIIHRKADSVGIKFISVNDTNPAVQNIDNYHRKQSISNSMELFGLNHDRLVTSVVRDDTLSEVYVSITKGQDNSDSSFYYFTDPANQTPYTFSPILEEKKKKKLVKVLFKWNPYYDSLLAHSIPGREFLFRRVDYSISDSIPKKAVAYFLAHEELLQQRIRIPNQ